MNGLGQFGRRIWNAFIILPDESPWHEYHHGAAILMSLLPNLQQLHLFCHGMFFDAAVDLTCLALLPHLRFLCVSFGVCSSKWHAASLPALPQLQHLSLSLQDVCETEPLLLPTASSALTSLTCLDIKSWNPELRSTPNVGQAVGRMHLLQDIWLAGVVTSIPPQFSDLPHLRRLSLVDIDNVGGDSGESGPFLQAGALQNCPCLTWLYLDGIPLSAASEWGMICKRLQSFKALQSLSILESHIFHQVPGGVWCLPNSLTSLRIVRGGLQTLPPAIAGLPHLRLLDLFDNMLECLPEGPYLDNLQRLDLWSKTLQDIPASLPKAVHLQELVMQAPVHPEPDSHSRDTSFLPPGCQMVEIVDNTQQWEEVHATRFGPPQAAYI